MESIKKTPTPYCPLMSAGKDVDMICTKERCAWWVPSIKKCSVYLLAYDALLNVNERQKRQ
jgi:hypothetical protein